MGGHDVAPLGVDTTKPNIARMYDYLLGGKDNFAVDREVAKMSLRIMPDSRNGPRSNRAFLRRVVRYLTAEAGIRQFLDIGSGLPTRGNVHEIAQEIAPEARVVYVDNDPMVLTHARALLAGDHTAVVTADICEPESILKHPTVRGLIEFDRPVGLLMFAILHHVNDFEDPSGVAATFRQAVPPGSHLAISHFQNPGDARPQDAEMARLGEKLFNKSFGTGRWRTPEEIRSYFGDWELLEPGVVPMPEWRPDLDGVRKKDLTHYQFVGGVARKP